MLSEQAERTLPYPQVALFELAADVEQYPQYLAGWRDARVYRREDNVRYVQQVLGTGPLRIRFISRAVLEPPVRIEVSSDDAQFRRLRLEWSFRAVAAERCGVRLAVELELASRLLQRLVEGLLRGTAGDVLAAFNRRAGEVYGASQGHHHQP